eukprot:3465427-Amphidinium_carterae.1
MFVCQRPVDELQHLLHMPMWAVLALVVVWSKGFLVPARECLSKVQCRARIQPAELHAANKMCQNRQHSVDAVYEP